MLLQTTFLSSVAPELFPAFLERSSYDLHSDAPKEFTPPSCTKAKKRTQAAPTDITPFWVEIHTQEEGIRFAYK